MSRKKTDISLSISNSIILCYVALLCLTAIIALPLSLLSIPVNLVTVSFIYNIITIFLFVKYKRSNERQLYHFNKFDTTNFCIMLFFIFIVFLRVFSLDINLSYFNTDIANHFEYAMSIVRTGKLNSMYFASLNNALFIEFLNPVFPGVNCYKSMIIAETVSHFISGMIFYVLISYKKRGKYFYYISPILMIMYFVGWPIYEYLLGGFVYWGMSVTLFLFGLYLLYLYSDFPAYRNKLLLLLLCIVYCIAVCYMLFVPYVLALYIFYFFRIFKNSSSTLRFTKRFISIVSIIGIIGTLILISVLHLFFDNLNHFFTALAMDGGIHKEFYRDYIYFIPFLCFLSTYLRKNKEFNINYFLLKIYSLFVIVSSFLCLFDILSPYYYYKLYFILWALVWLVTCDSIDIVLQECPSWLCRYACVLVFLLGFTFTPLEDIFIEKGLIENSVVEFPLYSAVGSYLKAPHETIFDDEDYWEIIYYLDENKMSAPIITDNDYYYWYHTFFDVNYYNSETINKDLSNLPNEFVLDKDSQLFITYEKKLNTKYEIIYDNSFATIYKMHYN